MTLDQIIRAGIDPAMKLLPANMDSKQARVMLLAIGLQESRFTERRQLVGNPPRAIGPAKSFWQGEKSGGMVRGVRNHDATRKMAAELYKALGVEPNDESIWNAIETDDVLAAGLARLLLWSDPLKLPALGDVENAFQLYLRTWRPGAWERGTPAQKMELGAKWGRNYYEALKAVQ